MTAADEVLRQLRATDVMVFGDVIDAGVIDGHNIIVTCHLAGRLQDLSDVIEAKAKEARQLLEETIALRERQERGKLDS